MKQYKVWNREDSINGVSASHFLEKQPFKNYTGDIILIYSPSGRVTNIECKDILASIYDIDQTLPIDTFMMLYFAKVDTQKK